MTAHPSWSAPTDPPPYEHPAETTRHHSWATPRVLSKTGGCVNALLPPLSSQVLFKTVCGADVFPPEKVLGKC